MERLELRGAVARYGERTVLDRLDVSIDSSERVAVIGPNGSGKTTLLRALAGIIPLSLGEARPVDGLPRHEIARRIAFLPQDESWEFAFTVADLVRFGRFAHSVSVFRSTAEDASAVDAALHAVGLADLRDRPVTELSGGERRRAALARALAQRAPALLLDE
ncbi:MAG: ABC transporter ATP-binding protein, partial [Planctomycetota bacterium]|nr:ABC transporter ATP-binding protein [Planctomycetota bacterium]